ncbi:MarR family transcriptional regulator [Devosia sp. YR412]|uniref:MarR family winged helix-turn-helix transcriptional regulator n=1 Tax=Devosia sp. YR412 TaxID=1881030 RepID=UPI000B836CDE|nr:MarR family transcriptional regulator [Devosia sp. YR412]
MASNKDNSPEALETVQLAEDLRRVTGKFVRAIRSQAQSPTTAQSETLGLLGRNGLMTVADLAERRDVRHQSMRVTIAQLEAAQLVAKTPNPADGRSALLAITDKGRQALVRSREARALQIAGLIEDRLSATERATLRAAIAVLDRLAG